LASLERDRVPSSRPVSTGYADLDKLLYGGIASNYAIILSARAYHRKPCALTLVHACIQINLILQSTYLLLSLLGQRSLSI
jgi:hypothetical protein